MSITVPVLTQKSALALIRELVKVLPHVKFHEVTSPENDEILKNAEIIICDFGLLAERIKDFPKAKWVQGTWAGVENLLPKIKTPPPFTITRFSGDHFGKIMSEYVITAVVQRERDFFRVRDSQLKGVWDREGTIMHHRTIYDLTFGILGVGQIGSRLGQTLKFMGAKVLAFGSRPQLPATPEYAFAARYHTRETLPALLKESDYVISVLPNTEQTTRLLDDDILQHCCKDTGTVLINVGRSNVVSEGALLKALEKGWLAGAVLDVFDEEPLPENHPFWKHKNIFLTPHVAAFSRPKDIAQLFGQNLELYLKNKPLPAQIDFSKGY